MLALEQHRQQVNKTRAAGYGGLLDPEPEPKKNANKAAKEEELQLLDLVFLVWRAVDTFHLCFWCGVVLVRGWDEQRDRACPK